MEPVINNAEQMADLGSSQQCEHANREVILRAPKSLHCGNSESLDFRVAATAAFINEGREYIAQTHLIWDWKLLNHKSTKKLVYLLENLPYHMLNSKGGTEKGFKKRPACRLLRDVA